MKNLKNVLITLLSLGYLVSAIAADKKPTLPKDIKWITNNDDPIYADSNAKKGGTLRMFLTSFPMTLRTVGPDANGSFRSAINGNAQSLTHYHPNTKKFIPVLATHWALDKDNKTIYYKLNKNARWSDGKPVTVEDYIFTLEFMKSEHIIAPWYNNHYKEWFDKIVAFDDHTIGIYGNKPLAYGERMETYGMTPVPAHFYKGKMKKGWPQEFQWKVVPNTGPYQISKVNKGKKITFERKKDWWAKDMRYFKHRFNVDRIVFTVVRDMNVAYEYFSKGKLDAFSAILPNIWHDKAKGEIFDNGYASKSWFYTDQPLANYGIWLNLDYAPLKDINLRKGIAHSMNIDKVLKTVLRNDYQRLNNQDEGKGAWNNPNIKAREFDIEKALDYFKKAGFSKRGNDGILVNDKGVRLSFEVNSGYAHHKDRMTVVKEEAKKAGLELVLKILDGATAFKKTREKKTQIVWMGWGTPTYPEYRQSLHSENAHIPQTNNISNVDLPEMDALIGKYRATFDEKEKIALAHKIQKLAFDNAHYIPTFKTPYTRSVYWSWLKFPKVPGTKLTDSLHEPMETIYGGGSTGGLFWIDKDAKKEILAAKKKGKKYQDPVVLINDTYKQ